MNSTFFLDPKSPLVFRTGRPFDQAGDPQTLAFPLPSSTAGALRTAYGDENELDFKQADVRKQLQNTPVYGPLAASLQDETLTTYFPCPADALYLKEGANSDGQLYRLSPEKLAEDEYSDLPQGLQPVFLQPETIKGKPVGGDRWWSEQHMLTWLSGKTPEVALDQLGWQGPKLDYRTHVAITPETLASEDSKLFQTQGLDFAPPKNEQGNGWDDQQYGLLVHLPDHQLQNNFRRLGGEGRTVAMLNQQQAWPSIDSSLTEQLSETSAIRLILTTPALFNRGWQPDWLDEKSLTGSPPGFEGKIRLTLRAFTTPRWEPLSGWDLAAWKPRAIRRMIPAGAVYWFEVLEGKEHLQQLWLQPISDRQQDRNDGFGLVLPGIWETTS
jgi:CRISPR-associated protein Cmr3